MLLTLEADLQAVLVDDEFMLLLKDALEVVLVEVDPSKLVDDLIDGLDEFHSFFEVFCFVNLLGEQSDDEVRMGAGEGDHQVERVLEVEAVQDKDDMDDFLGLLVVFRRDLLEGLARDHD
jgi:hypothetical protein